MQPLAHIFITTFNRPQQLKNSLASLRLRTKPEDYRLTIVHDGVGDYGPKRHALTQHVIEDNCDIIDQVLEVRQNQGLGPAINKAIALIESEDLYYEDRIVGSATYGAPFICYCQDDLLYTDDWLRKLVTHFLLFERSEKLGFASGVECVEHPVNKVLIPGVVTKDWIRAAQMLARREYWSSMMPIPYLDPETGTKRARPNDGMGSSVDWWFIRDHMNSVCKTGRTNLVMPGLVTHAGYDASTWLKRELPESDADKDEISRFYEGKRR